MQAFKIVKNIIEQVKELKSDIQSKPRGAIMKKNKESKKSGFIQMQFTLYIEKVNLFMEMKIIRIIFIFRHIYN